MTIVTWVLLGLLLVGFLSTAWSLLHVLRQHGRLLLRVEALEARIGTDGGLEGRSKPVCCLRRPSRRSASLVWMTVRSRWSSSGGTRAARPLEPGLRVLPADRT